MTFQIECWRDFYPDAALLMQRHWEEIALDRAAIPYSLNTERYEAMDDAGILHVLAAREEGRLAGYYMAFVMPHLHYQHAGLMAYTDVYYLLPHFRQGANGMRLFIEAERSLIRKGCVKGYLSTKVKLDQGAMFESLGWTLTDRVFTKLFKKEA